MEGWAYCKHYQRTTVDTSHSKALHAIVDTCISRQLSCEVEEVQMLSQGGKDARCKAMLGRGMRQSNVGLRHAPKQCRAEACAEASNLTMSQASDLAEQESDIEKKEPH
eukprot:scaffold32757_cov17-Tisochrysis_lutea.AAC.1